MRVRAPTPERARASAHQLPTPPRPNTATWAAVRRSIAWSPSSIWVRKNFSSIKPPKKGGRGWAPSAFWSLVVYILDAVALDRFQTFGQAGEPGVHAVLTQGAVGVQLPDGIVGTLVVDHTPALL